MTCMVYHIRALGECILWASWRITIYNTLDYSVYTLTPYHSADISVVVIGGRCLSCR